ncbi:glycosyltransferase family 2 protein [Baekduia alba]|uniref:glycosyltransferase family 2 protein n=1 Tax=Baekduia alba TaxID=2997333 RepID=UPI002341E8A3|nr:glycosyltransferase [Baekduia alba]
MPLPPVPTVSVVMPTYNRRAQLRSVLAPLLADPAASEVVVVVDGCDDGSLQDLEAMTAEHPQLVPVWQENAGEGAARQAGVERATGDVVLLLDDDVEAEGGLVAGHARRHADRADLVVLGYMPPVPPQAGDPDAFSVLLYAEAYEGRCESYENDPDLILRHLWAGNVSLRRATVLEVGVGSDVYDERYHPDREFGLRLLAHGLTGVFDRGLRARHHYQRPLDAFVRDARSQGAGWTLVSQLHGEDAGALPADRFEAGLPAPVAALVHLCRRPRAAALASAALTAGVRAATTAGNTRAALACARLLRRVEQQRGAIELRRRHAQRG